MKRFISLVLSIAVVTGALVVFPIAANAAALKAPSAVKLTSKPAGFTVKFTKSKSKVSGYKIKYSLKSNFSGSKVVKIAASKSSKTVSGIKEGKKYYVKVCAYKGSKTSKWTAKKTVTTKFSSKTMKSYILNGCWCTYIPSSKAVCAVFFKNKSYGNGYKEAKNYYYHVRNNKLVKDNVQGNPSIINYKVVSGGLSCIEEGGMKTSFKFTTSKTKLTKGSRKYIHFSGIPSYSQLKKYF